MEKFKFLISILILISVLFACGQKKTKTTNQKEETKTKEKNYILLDREDTMTGWIFSIRADVSTELEASKIAKSVADSYSSKEYPVLRVVVYDNRDNMIGILGKNYNTGSYFGGLRDYVR